LSAKPVLWIGAGLLLVAAGGCGGGEVRPPKPAKELVSELVGAEEVLDERGDYWSSRLGDYLAGPELAAYEGTPPGLRFERYAHELLEFRLRENLLERHRWTLSRQDIEHYRSQPDYDAGLKFLRERGLDVARPAREEDR